MPHAQFSLFSEEQGGSLLIFLEPTFTSSHHHHPVLYLYLPPSRDGSGTASWLIAHQGPLIAKFTLPVVVLWKPLNQEQGD